MILWMKCHLSRLFICVLIAICIFLLYAWIDARVTIDHAWRVVDWEKHKTKVLRDLLQETGKHMSRSEITRFVKEYFKDEQEHVIKEEGDEISVDDIILKFEGKTLSEIKFLDEE